MRARKHEELSPLGRRGPPGPDRFRRRATLPTARFGYGFLLLGDRFTARPEIAVGLSATGRDYSLGWRLAHGGEVPDGGALELAAEVRRQESATDRSAPPEHEVGFRVTSRF